jgi:hypothetical protein
MIVVMVALCGVCSLGVDLGRVQLTKTELRRAADAAARAAAARIPDGRNAATSSARTIAQLNKADGQPVELDNGDIEFGRWDIKTRTFNRINGANLSQANAVRVVVRRTARGGDAVPLVFGKILGIDSCDVTAETIVMFVPEIKVNETIQATSNPFLSGMPSGSVASRINPHNSPDYAGNASNPQQSAFAVKGLPVEPGTALTFDSIAGTARHDPNLPYFSPDGELSDIGHNNLTRNSSSSYSSGYYNENGIADMRAPINALVGVFLTDDRPDRSPAPANLDFSTAASRDFATLEPQLKQIFFIGDGKRSGGAAQEFVVPEGATRLFLATWDFYEWNNNAGWREVKITRPQKIVTVK